MRVNERERGQAHPDLLVLLCPARRRQQLERVYGSAAVHRYSNDTESERQTDRQNGTDTYTHTQIQRERGGDIVCVCVCVRERER